MARKDPKSLLERSAKALQENAERSGPAAGASYTMIGAIAVCGALGYGIDRWTGMSPWFLVGGLLFGIVIGMWEIAKIVWHK
jgi:F0F1-type ATP synthase assembly protein I